MSTAAATTRAPPSTAVPDATTASDATRPARASGSPFQRSPASSGASSTATTIWITSTAGKTRIAERAWRTVISLSRPRPAAPPAAASHASAVGHSPPSSASATTFVE